MKLLVMDTSNSTCCAGIYEDDKEIVYEMSLERKTHSETFMPMVHSCMQKAGLSHKDLDGYAITVGPGSFTGIRIGLSAVKGMAVASDKPCVELSSVDCLAYSVEPMTDKDNTILVPCFDARNKRVFGAVKKFSDMSTLVCENAYSASELVGKISLIPNTKEMDLIVCGNGADSMREAIEESGVAVSFRSVDYASGCAILPSGIAHAAFRKLESLGDKALINAQDAKASYCAVSSAERSK